MRRDVRGREKVRVSAAQRREEGRRERERRIGWKERKKHRAAFHVGGRVRMYEVGRRAGREEGEAKERRTHVGGGRQNARGGIRTGFARGRETTSARARGEGRLREGDGGRRGGYVTRGSESRLRHVLNELGQ